MFRLSLILILIFSACSFEQRGIDDSTSSLEEEVQIRRYAWEIWRPGKDFDNQEILDPYIFDADKEYREGKKLSAFQTYNSIDLKEFSLRQKEAITYRKAAYYLANSEPGKALKLLTDFCKQNKLDPEHVSAEVSLLFGFAFGGEHDFEQSLAWFSKSAREGSETVTRLVKSNVKLLVNTISSENLQTVMSGFENDSFILELIKKELELRESPDYVANTRIRFFWDNKLSVIPTSKNTSDLTAGAKTGGVGLLVPLSGKYSELGESTRNGFEIARSVQSSDLPIFVKDAGPSIPDTIQAWRGLMDEQHVKAVVGPLLAEPALELSKVARNAGAPLLVLTKNSEFVTGQGVFRIAPTAKDQVKSLIEAARLKLGASKFGIVFPDNKLGVEYNQIYRRLLREVNLNVVFSYPYQETAVSAFSGVGEQIVKSGAEVVFFPDSIDMAAKFMQEQMADSRSRFRLMGTASWEESGKLEKHANWLDQTIFVRSFSKTSSDPTVRSFVQAYQAQFGKEPDFFAAQGFDIGMMLISAIKRSGSESYSLGSALSAISSYQGLTGKIHVAPSGEFERYFEVVELSGQKINTISQSADFIYR